MTAIVDRIDTTADRIRDDEFLADQKRVTYSLSLPTPQFIDASQFESFKLGGAPPAQSTRRHSHSRSHSRNVSISFSSSFHDISLSSSNSISSLSQPPAPTTKRNSHHRRRSSVSTRRESAEVMGVTLPALSASNSEDNVTLGDKDSIRRRALWALEGKPSPDGFSPVEIPELSSPEIERRISELSSKPSFPPVMGSFTSGLSGLTNIRDSFSSRVTSSIKDQLHTLVEEEEEEEEPPASASPPVDASSLPAAVIGSPSPARHRPAGLTLRPLSLSPDRLMTTVTGEQLPTPDSAPTPTKPTGLKSLTLASSPSLTSPSSSPDGGVLSRATALHRRSVVVPPTHASSSASKRSSISYKPSFQGLPTPELTPTTEGRPLIGSETEWGRPPSLTNEQHFLYQSQAALVARITELERSLSFRTCRPVSLAASDSSSSVAEPTDEMLRLIADLKAERDELKRDVDGWRTRVADLEKRSGVLALRVDTERREAWIARERLSLLEVEKRAAVRAAEESDAAVKSLQAELTTTKADLQAAQEEAVRNQEIMHELECVRAELMGERRLREDLEKSLEELSLLKTPTPVAPIRRVMSIDSMSSATDVDSLDEHTMSGPELKAVQEVDEDEEVYSEHENNLMGYEDEEEGDDTFTSQNGSSFGSLEDIPCSTPHLDASVASSPSRTPSPAPLPTHARRSSLSREWSFPAKGAPHAASPQHFPEEVDRFFGCLEDMGDSPPISAAPPETTSPFTKGFFGAASEEEDEMPPFVLPADVGVEVESPPAQDPACFSGSGLGVVLEEDELSDAEDMFVGEEDEGGIKFKFEIPPAFISPAQTPSPITPQTRKPVPFCELSSEDEDAAFTFPSASLVSRKTASPPSPSAIPRATVLKRFEGPTRNAKPSPPRATPSPPAASSRNGSPLSDRSGGARPSFLPHPTVKPIAAPTFIPQPSSLTKVRVLPPPSIPRSPLRSQPPPPSSAIAMSGSPFAALQNFASFVVPSWSITRGAAEENSTATTTKANEEAKIETEKKMGFVSKERQLARLRERMAEEGVVAVPCRRCVDPEARV
ncbi:hypothetical protein EDB86DRAFT_3076906 [Lactarius hatsudake]|nr:hypothetical protein EDB86DRAFT_3076906 [Lactarius hatsudake]